MSSDPKNPGNPPPPEAPAAAPATPAAPPMPGSPGAFPMPFTMPAAPPMQPGFAMPGFAQPMPGMPAGYPPGIPQQYAPQPPAPIAPPSMPVMNAPHAVAQPAAKAGPVIGTRDEYRFGEEAVAQKTQVTLLETPKVTSDLPSPTKIDPNFDALKIALEAQMARNAIAPLMYVPPNATRWFRFSPFELFLEQVLARKLWTLE